MKVKPILLMLLAGAAVLYCCQGASSAGDAALATKPEAQALGSFSADSAFSHISSQVAMGPRIAGTPTAARCAEYISDRLQAYGADTVIEQRASVTTYTGQVIPITNVLGRFNPGAKRRVLLLAHYDTRPWADHENDSSLRYEPIDGANDGGSGVGVLLEIARNLGIKPSEVGVDLLFVDAEDYGTHADEEGFGIIDDENWCLGTQKWVTDMPYDPDHRPVYGILLDMVGGRDAVFHREYFSNRDASAYVDKIWSEAKALGYEDIFINKLGGSVIDDHVYTTRAGIPTVDIIENTNSQTSSFPPTWHTLSDNLENIDRNTLQRVGNTVLNVIYKEKG